MRVLSIGDRVPDGTFRLHSRFERVVNLTDGRGVVSIVRPEVGEGPVNIVVDACPSGSGRVLVVWGGGGRARSFSLAGRALDTCGSTVYDSRIAVPRWHGRHPWSRHSLAMNLDALRRVLVASAPGKSLAYLLDPRRRAGFRPGFERSVAAHMADCARDVLAGDVFRAAHRLSGCGFGLTPSGDDFICGLLIAMHVHEAWDDVSLEPVRSGIVDVALTGNTLTDTFLSLASEGRVSRRTNELLVALTTGGADDVRAKAPAVIAVGETSGADFATGLVYLLQAYASPLPVASMWTLGACAWSEAGVH